MGRIIEPKSRMESKRQRLVLVIVAFSFVIQLIPDVHHSTVCHTVLLVVYILYYYNVIKEQYLLNGLHLILQIEAVIPPLFMIIQQSLDLIGNPPHWCTVSTDIVC